MAPVKFTLFPWQNSPVETTPVDQTTLQSLETRLSKFTEEYEVHFLAPVKELGQLISKTEAKGEAELGDVRLVEELGELYWWRSTAKAWEPLYEKQTVSFVTAHTFSIGGTAEITTAASPLPGSFIRLLPWATPTETQSLIGAEIILAGKGEAGAEIELTLEYIRAETSKAVTEFEKIKVAYGKKPTTIKFASPLALANGDQLVLIINSVTKKPKELTVSAFIEHKAKVT